MSMMQNLLDYLQFKCYIVIPVVKSCLSIYKWANKADPSVGWNGITKATPLKEFPPEEPNRTDPEEVITKLSQNDEVNK